MRMSVPHGLNRDRRHDLMALRHLGFDVRIGRQRQAFTRDWQVADLAARIDQADAGG